METVTSNLKEITPNILNEYINTQKLIDAKVKELFWYYQTLRDKIRTDLYFKTYKDFLTVSIDYTRGVILYKAQGSVNQSYVVIPTALLTSKFWFSKLEAMVQAEQDDFIANKLRS